MIPLDDRGLLLGDGLFETILWSEGQLEHLDAHAKRLARGCKALGLPPPDPDALETAALDAVDAAGLHADRAAVRLTWTAGSGGRGLDRPELPAPRLFASAAASPAPSTPARLATVAVRRNEGSPASRHKTLNYLDNVLARREARTSGADEALMFNNRGEVAGGAAANLFWFEGDTLLTPALECGVLDGVMRGLVIDRAARLGIAVHEVTATDLEGATGVFLTNSLIGVRPVHSIDGAPVIAHSAVRRLSSAT